MNNTPYSGSLDPFEDIVDRLQAMDVSFVLMVGMQGSPRTQFWTNMADYGTEGVGMMCAAFGGGVSEALSRVEDDRGDDCGCNGY